MSDEFRKKLKLYENGELTGQELEDFEKELEKLEAYQEILEYNSDKEKVVPTKKQKKIINRGKWKARIQTGFTALGLFIFITILSTILTAFYYSWGKPDRAERYRDIIDYTLTITDPYGEHGGTSTNTKPYFGLETTRDLNKVIGDEVIKIGELKVNFLFSSMAFPETSYIGKETQTLPSFIHPLATEEMEPDWNKLEKLPEGTVVSAYVSFDELMETKDVEQFFSNKDMRLLWLAVDTGREANNEHLPFSEPIGFPSSPIWHDDDMILQSHEEEKGWFGSKNISESYSSPTYHEGDQDMLHTQFMKTLDFLKEHEKKANRLVFDELHLDERIDYLKQHEILHYGAVITGPTKEILKLKDEETIRTIMVDEVEFWNWN